MMHNLALLPPKQPPNFNLFGRQRGVFPILNRDWKPIPRHTKIDNYPLFLAGTKFLNPALTTISWPGMPAGATLADKAEIMYNFHIPFLYSATINPQKLIREPHCTYKAPEFFNSPTEYDWPDDLFTERSCAQVHGTTSFKGLRYASNNSLPPFFPKLLLRADSVLTWMEIKEPQKPASRSCRVGYAFSWNSETIIKHRLENEGPTGIRYEDTWFGNARGELRALLAALTYYPWEEEGWTEIVIATCSYEIVESATFIAPAWIENDQLTIPAYIKYPEVWELFLKEVARLSNQNIRVYLWDVSDCGWCPETLDAAEEMARIGEDVLQWKPLKGVPS
jgi:ribonuclease HI